MTATKILLTLEGKHLSAKVGDNLLDALLQQGIQLPHNCRAGACHSCAVMDSKSNKVILACQTSLADDLDLNYIDSVPQVAMTLTAVEQQEEHFLLSFSGAFSHYFFQYIKLCEITSQQSFSTRVLSASMDMLEVQLPISPKIRKLIENKSTKWRIQDNISNSLTNYNFNTLPFDSTPVYLIITEPIVSVFNYLLLMLREITSGPVIILLLLPVELLESEVLIKWKNAVVNDIFKTLVSSFVFSNEKKDIESIITIWSSEQKNKNFMFSRSSCVIVANDKHSQTIASLMNDTGLSNNRIHAFNNGKSESE